ncbi:hypothetical protein Ahy_A05g024447 [Arachis hypogaea]|uniref:Helitron helicase-like domain-containing protein n=1 Tax=Arachis hypogaea TaxID=3818 RepID=A0A445D5T9_ARAHY|nr:hypothetical protein Ahy_A05g024447 [Arachis hypogaea]
MKEFFSFRKQERLADGSPLLYSRRLFQQFLVDDYSMIESTRLNFIRLEQEKLRCELYKGLKEAVMKQGSMEARRMQAGQEGVGVANLEEGCVIEGNARQPRSKVGVANLRIEGVVEDNARQPWKQSWRCQL